MTTDISERRYEFDWLRVMATLVVFTYHSTRFFNLGDWHVKNANTYVWVEIWNVFAMTWLMPLFFIISGVGLFYTIGKSGGFSKFYGDKFQRLMIPVFFAVLTHSALQVYLERLSHGRFSGSFFSFLPEYFNGVYTGIGASGNFAFVGMHLWYLFFLFLYGIICYHLFLWLKGRGEVFLHRISALFAMPGLIYLWFSIPFLVMKAVVPPEILSIGAGSWGFLYYVWFLISGFIIISSKRLQETIKNQRWVSLIFGVVFSSFHIYRLFNSSRIVFPVWIAYWMDAAIYFFSAWFWVFAILGFGMRFLIFNRPILRKLNEGVLPFYILHQTVLVYIGYFVMNWEIPDFFKWAIVFVSAFISIICLYVFVVGKFEVFRFLFGMKTTRPVFRIFRKRSALVFLHVVYVGLIISAVNVASARQTPMPMTHVFKEDIILDATSVTGQSSTGVTIVSDTDASRGHAVEFVSGANKWAQSHPKVYLEMHFKAPAGRYTVWLRGKCDVDGNADSVWLQVDDQIGTRLNGFRMGNWLDIHSTGVYGWAGDAATPVVVELKHTGDHAVRIQPRQTPHRIDQIWMSRKQSQIPNSFEAISR